MPRERPMKKTLGSLEEQLHQDKFVSRQKNKQNRDTARALAEAGMDEADDDGEVARMEPRAAKRILEASRAHLQAPDSDNEEDDDDDEAGVAMPDGEGFAVPDAFSGDHDAGDGELDEDEDDVDLEYDDHESVATTIENPDVEALGEAFGITEEETAMFDRFQPRSAVQGRNLADIIMAKIHEKNAAGSSGAGKADDDDDEGPHGHGGPRIDIRVRKVYIAIGRLLKRYKSGKLPKAFKVLPHVQNWEALAFLTSPQTWSPHAAYAATKMFSAHLNELMAQRFYNAILLPIVHQAMQGEEKKLHPALFNALRKALFKPKAFFRGFLLPLCNEGECSVREALAVCAVLQKMHLPPAPTAVAVYKISELPYTPANGLFLRVLIDKKMNLPFQVIDQLVKYFHRFTVSHSSTDKLPVVWHQSLLCFVQHYKASLSQPQRDLLRKVCTKHFHHMITPEVRREIAAGEGKATAEAVMA